MNKHDVTVHMDALSDLDMQEPSADSRNDWQSDGIDLTLALDDVEPLEAASLESWP
jgi:hypothetical protein